MSKIYQSLAKTCEHTYEEKRSRFIAYIFPVSSKEDGFAHFSKLKTQYPDARHHCWAYLLGNPEQAQSAGFNDDGEPSGTAGKPMLNVLTQRKVGDVFAVVVRYFGGVKLGAGGLTRAYGQAVSRALDDADLITVEPMCTVLLSADFALENALRMALKKYTSNSPKAVYGDGLTLSCEIIDFDFEELTNDICNLSNGKAQCFRAKQKTIPLS